MARQEINIFGTSFLDLLSGALAAVIILFIIVPKMTAEQQNALEEIEQLNIEVRELSQLMEQLQNTVPADVYEQVRAQIERLQNAVSALTTQVENMQRRLSALQAENEQLRSEIEALRVQQQQSEALRAENQTLRAENEQLRQQMAQLQQQLQQATAAAQRAAQGRIFGLNADLGVVCAWKENVDVDLYVKNLATGEECWYNKKKTSFGNLNEDVISRADADDDRYELFYQTRIKPGRYLIRVNIYGGSYGNSGSGTWRGQPVKVDGYAVIFPGKSNQVRIPFPSKTLTSKGTFVTIGTLVVTSNNIQLYP